MTQIVFLLFENSQAPTDSKDRYRVEIHFSPGAKGREEIIACGGRASSLKLVQKKHSVPMRRMLPNNVNHQKASHLEVSSADPKRPAKSLPVLMSPEELETVRQVASKSSLLDADTYEPSKDQLHLSSVPSFTFKPSLPCSSSDIDTITEELSKCSINLFAYVVYIIFS